MPVRILWGVLRFLEFKTTQGVFFAFVESEVCLSSQNKMKTNCSGQQIEYYTAICVCVSNMHVSLDICFQYFLHDVEMKTATPYELASTNDKPT